MYSDNNRLAKRAPCPRARKLVGWTCLLGLALASLISSGCTGVDQWIHKGFKVGPEYFRPPAPVADNWIDEGDPRVSSEEADYSYWWTCFNDPVLDQLVDAAQQQNLTLREAGMRILEARANAAIARGSLFPQTQQFGGSYNHGQTSGQTNQAVGGGPVFAPTLDTWDVGFNASWELDFWGRFRRNIEATDADWNATIEDYDGVLVILQAEVAAAA